MQETLDFFFDLASVYSYLASTQLPQLSARTGVRVRYRPMVLHAVYQATDNRMPASSPAKARWLLGDAKRWAARYGVPFVMNRRFPLSTIPAMRLVIVGERHGRAAEVTAEAFRRAWALDEDPNEPAILEEIARTAGLPAGAHKEISEQSVKDTLRANTDEAIARGIFGAPSMFVGDELFFGNDRLPFVEEALLAARGA